MLSAPEVHQQARGNLRRVQEELVGHLAALRDPGAEADAGEDEDLPAREAQGRRCRDQNTREIRQVNNNFRKLSTFRMSDASGHILLVDAGHLISPPLLPLN